MAAVLAPLLSAMSMPSKQPELATVPSPRTAWSTHNAREERMWRACHRQLITEAERYTPAAPGQRRLVLFGDSLVESWSGRTYCASVPKFRGAAEMLHEAVGPRWHRPDAPPLALGISSDQTQHLLWRLQHGELPARLTADPGLQAVLLIGTNNLGAGHAVGQVVAGIEATASLLLNRTSGQLLVHGLLPRADASRRYPASLPTVGRATSSGAPLCSFLPAIAQVNAALNASIRGGALRARFGRRVRFVDCGAPFLQPAAAEASRACPRRRVAAARAAEGEHEARTGRRLSGVNGLKKAARRRPPVLSAQATSEVRLDLMPDRLHPSHAGHRVWAQCLSEHLGSGG